MENLYNLHNPRKNAVLIIFLLFFMKQPYSKLYVTYFDKQNHRGCREIWRFRDIWLRYYEFPYHILRAYAISQQSLRPYIPTKGIIYLFIRFLSMMDKL